MISLKGHPLNDILLQGPSLYPLLTTVTAQFRRHKIGMSADISKMFREISLTESDQDFHRFNSNSQMVVSRYFWHHILAIFGLLQVAEDHKSEFPEATQVVQQSFYVDDCLTGANSIPEAKKLKSDLNSLLSLACFTLRNWRSNSP